MPWLYHPYAGHDNNRDWFMFNLKESRLTAPVLYSEWYPEIVLDQHQMGSSGARLFLPPYSDPVNPNVSSALMALELKRLVRDVIAESRAVGLSGELEALADALDKSANDARLAAGNAAGRIPWDECPTSLEEAVSDWADCLDALGFADEIVVRFVDKRSVLA